MSALHMTTWRTISRQCLAWFSRWYRCLRKDLLKMVVIVIVEVEAFSGEDSVLRFSIDPTLTCRLLAPSGVISPHGEADAKLSTWTG